jgi:hypothetical protein
MRFSRGWTIPRDWCRSASGVILELKYSPEEVNPLVAPFGMNPAEPDQAGLKAEFDAARAGALGLPLLKAETSETTPVRSTERLFAERLVTALDASSMMCMMRKWYCSSWSTVECGVECLSA